MERLVSLLGLITMLAVAWLLSEHRRRISIRLVVSGLALQFGLAVLFLATPLHDSVFHYSGKFVEGLMHCSGEGAKFVFGSAFYSEEFKSANGGPFFFATVLPMVIFFASLTAVLFHLGILQLIVRLMARVMIWVMDVSGSESLCTSANVFIGMTTAPLMVRPYLQTMTRSEVMAMMTGGMATASGATLPAYVFMGADAGHLMVASLLSAPAALVIAKIMVPEREESPTKGIVKVEVKRPDANLLDAACRGAGEGLKLSLNIAGMLIAFVALIALINLLLTPTGWLLGQQPLTLQQILGWLGAPVAWLLGVPWQDAPEIGRLLGEKTVLNEFIAYGSLDQLQQDGEILQRSHTIATYALCGFANFGSIAIMIGGIGGLVPERRKDYAKYGFRSLIGGSLAAFMTAAIAGILI